MNSSSSSSSNNNMLPSTTSAHSSAPQSPPMMRRQMNSHPRAQSNTATSPSPSAPPAHKTSKSRQVLVACAACQKRKSKCTGERPRCSLCTLKNTECVYETRFGEARSAQLKRRVHELSQENNSLRDVINTLRTADSYQASHLLDRIRSTTELDEALRLIGDSALLLSVRREESDSLGSGSNASNASEEEKGRYKRMAIDDLLS